MYSMVAPIKPRSLQSDPRLLLYASQGPYRYVPARVWHSDAPFFRGVLELLMAADLIDFVPAVFPQFLDHLPAVHHRPLTCAKSLYTPFTHRAVLFTGSYPLGPALTVLRASGSH